MELICYLHPSWKPLIRPAEVQREWMTAAPESFAYRCLPLNIANSHGWEVLSPCAFEACWNGTTGTDAVTIRITEGDDPVSRPVSIFGQGVLTFHVAGLLRTPPGWNLWITGSPNRPKDGIQPLSGVVETDWSPFTFTMNWLFTRPNQWVRFEQFEPMCFIFPVQRGAVESFEPRFEPIDSDPELAERFMSWSKGRDSFQERMQRDPPALPSDKWQKHYYRGTDSAGEVHAPDHQAKLKVQAFKNGPPLPPSLPAKKAAPQARAPAPAVQAPASDTVMRDLAKREWLLEAMERLKGLSTTGHTIQRRGDLGRDEFLERYYAANRPVILTGEMEGWPALDLWTPQYLAQKVGPQIIEYQGGRSADPLFERNKDALRREAPFDRFIETITGEGAGNDAYITAYNSGRNAEALAGLRSDLGFPEKLLVRGADGDPGGMMWIGPAGTMTSLHHDLTNNLIAQVVGRKRLRIMPAAEVAKVYNREHVFSDVMDIADPALSLANFPKLAGARVFDVTLEPGEMIFMPVAWWHQVQALDFSVTLTYTNFIWPNDVHGTYPAG